MAEYIIKKEERIREAIKGREKEGKERKKANDKDGGRRRSPPKNKNVCSAE